MKKLMLIAALSPSFLSAMHTASGADHPVTVHRKERAHKIEQTKQLDRQKAWQLEQNSSVHPRSHRRSMSKIKQHVQKQLRRYTR